MAAYDGGQSADRAGEEPTVRAHWAVGLGGWLIRVLRPARGWVVALSVVMLAVITLITLRGAGWGNPRQAALAMEWLGLWAVLIPWAVYTLLAKRTPRPRLILPMLVHWLAAPLAIAQILVGWLPSLAMLWRAWQTPALSGGWPQVGWQMVADLQRLGLRLLIWGQGIQSGGATQDDLVFLALALLVVWLVAGWSVALVLGGRSGLVAGLPLLWLLGSIVYYSHQGRWFLVMGLAVGIALHFRVDQQRLFADWTQRAVAFSSDIAVERAVAAVVAALPVLVIAAILPNLFIMPLARSAYAAMKPWNDMLASTGDQFFPEMQRDFYGRFSSGELGGLPNSFLLGAGPDLGEQVVMQVRTNETRTVDRAGPGPERIPEPVGHYVRGATLSIYTGQGWDNPTVMVRRDLDANQPWSTGATSLAADLRRPLLQSVFLTQSSPVIYAAPEPVAVSVATQGDLGPMVAGDGALVALRPQNRSAARSYTVLSSLPDVDATILAALSPLAADAPGLDAYLALPDTITPRTRQLAADLRTGRDSAYAIAAAIEAHLRTLPYDLSVAELPADVADVADYFLFDLQRGYCDYYATAFVVLARLAGLPSRFATGYVPGSWDGTERVWTITEAEAHSWPEVYFPDVGWIPFEPTAGRPALVRDLPRLPQGPQQAESLPAFEPFEPVGVAWNPQMLIWLLPIGLLMWGMVALLWRRRLGREDAWLGLLAWGRRLGHPPGVGETDLEYGRGLADHVAGLGRRTPEQRRVVSREILALSREASQVHYGPVGQRGDLQEVVRRRWQRLRGHLLRLWLGR